MKTISLHLLDLLQNSIVAGASFIEVDVAEDRPANSYSFRITDNGKGMSPAYLKKVTDPFTTSRTTRKVGLGLPLIKMNAELCEGTFTLSSEEGKGTILFFSFQHDHIDRPPLGNIAEIIVLCAAQNEHIRFVYTHKTDKGEYRFDSDEVKDSLEGISMNQLEVIRFLEEMITENLMEIGCSE